MIIYKAYLEYGPYNGGQDLGYYSNVLGAIAAIRKSANHPNYPSVLGKPRHDFFGRISWPTIDPWAVGFPEEDHCYVIQKIEVQP